MATLFEKQDQEETKVLQNCPYCKGSDVVRRGKRIKKHESVNLYFCKNCQKKFTPLVSKNKTYPLRVILDCITSYNRLKTLEESAEQVGKKYGLKISPQNILNWVKDYGRFLPFLRIRSFAEKKYDRREIIVEQRMFHGQIYDFKYHRAKTDLILEEDFKNYKLSPIREFLELVSAECPHSIFKDNPQRASEFKDVFNLDQVKIIPKSNAANETARFVMQAVANNKLRHEILQHFMLVNDSVTVAVEVPILLEKEDLLHYQNELAFDVPLRLEEKEVITGHIDILQLRNGMIHILDFKPSASKVKPVEQLTIYALALSRLTSLRLYNFKCAWFDEDDYYEFYPLHVVYKKKKKSRMKAK